MKAVQITLIIIQLGLGGLFIYAGVRKFIPKERKSTVQVEAKKEQIGRPDKMKEFIGGLKNSGYFWQFLGFAEIVGGVLLVSQYLALLGALWLLPITLNIFLFHYFLKPDDPGDILLTGLYLLGNLFIIVYHFPKLKSTFIQLKPIKS